MGETYSVYNENGTLVDELARCRVIKISQGVYTWEIEPGGNASGGEGGLVEPDDYDAIRAEISADTPKAGIPIEWAVDGAKDFYLVAVSGGKIIDGLSDANWSFSPSEKVLWVSSPFDDGDWICYVFRNERPVNNFAIAEGRAKITAIQAQFEKDSRILRQIIAGRGRVLRVLDRIETLPEKSARAGKVLGFDSDGNPDLTLAKEDVAGAYTARDEAVENAKSALESGKSAAESASKAAASEGTVKKSEQTVLEAERRVIGTVEGEINEINSAKENALKAIGDISTPVLEAKEEAESAASDAKAAAVQTASDKAATQNHAASAAGSAGAAENAKAGAESAKSGAEAAKTSAEAAKNAAETAAANAANSETSAEISASSAAGSAAQASGKLEEINQAVEDGLESIAEAIDPDGKLVQLQGRAASVGEFFFDSGKLAGQDPSPIQSLPFSFCFTATRGLHFVNNTRILRSGLETSGNCAYIWMANASNPAFVVTLRSGNAQIRNVAYDFSPYADAFHTFVITVSDKLDSNNYPEVRAYVDGREIAKRSDAGTPNPPMDISTAEPLNIGSANTNTPLMQGTLGRIKIFNFDMSADGAPYSIVEYCAGIDESPALRQCTPGLHFENDSAKFPTVGTWGNGTAVYDGTNIVVSGFDTGRWSLLACTFPEAIAAGSRVRVKLRFESENSASYNCQLYETSAKRLAMGTATDGADFEWEGVCTVNAAHLYIQASAASWTGAEYRLVSSSVEVLGPVLSLANSADGAVVRDLSGNKNHMMLSGMAVPSKLNNPALAPQKISWAGTATAQNVCGEKGAPADSLVTIYARASSAVSLSVKCATNAAASKDLTAGVWTLCGSWTVPTAGAITATPSAAFTGNVEFSTKIERFK